MTERQAKESQPNFPAQAAPTAALSRYARQIAFAPFGPAGQQRLAASHVVLIGCGALGSHVADLLVRAGLGRLRIVDRDYLELNNLQRQTLFDETDLAANLPKAEAAARKLRRINSHVQIEPFVGDLNHESIEYCLAGAHIILDGTDNLQTRLLINDAAVKHRLPWVYGACLGAQGIGLVILPGGKPCLRCVLDEPVPPGRMDTCETAGILAPVVAAVAAFEVVEALKILSGNLAVVNRRLVSFNLWTNEHRELVLGGLAAGCDCCGRGNFEFLAGKGGLSTISLCGRDSVQIRPRTPGLKIDLAALADRLHAVGPVQHNDFLLRLKLPARSLEMTVFPDARAIVKGTHNTDEARSLYAQFVGH